MNVNEDFNHSLYNELSGEDRELIDEYKSRLDVSDLNSFMRRLVAHYPTESARIDILEVEEEPDSILVFESNKVSKNASKTINKSINDDVLAYISKYSQSNNDIIKCLCESIRFHIETCQSYDLIKFREYVFNYMVKLLITNQHKYFRALKNKILPAQLYTYRIENRVNKTRLGAVLDCLDGGFDQNFKIYTDTINVRYGSNDVSGFVKSANFWSPKNATIHGFDEKVGIIWFNGSLNNNYWVFPDKSLLKIGSNIQVDLLYTTNAFAKMINRLKINKIIEDVFRLLTK